MASFNQVLGKVRVGSIVKDGKEVILSLATQTSTWSRSAEIAQRQGPVFQAAVEKGIDKVDPDTEEIVARDARHTSEADPRDHITGIQLKKVAGDKEAVDGKSTHFET